MDGGATTPGTTMNDRLTKAPVDNNALPPRSPSAEQRPMPMPGMPWAPTQGPELFVPGAFGPAGDRKADMFGSPFMGPMPGMGMVPQPTSSYQAPNFQPPQPPLGITQGPESLRQHGDGKPPPGTPTISADNVPRQAYNVDFSSVNKKPMPTGPIARRNPRERVKSFMGDAGGSGRWGRMRRPGTRKVGGR